MMTGQPVEERAFPDSQENSPAEPMVNSADDIHAPRKTRLHQVPRLPEDSPLSSLLCIRSDDSWGVLDWYRVHDMHYILIMIQYILILPNGSEGQRNPASDCKIYRAQSRLHIIHGGKFH